MKDVKDPRAIIVSGTLGFPRYECPLCGYDSLDESRLIEHLDPDFGKHPIPRDPLTHEPLPTDPLTTRERAELEALRTEVAALRADATVATTPRAKLKVEGG